MKEHSGGAGGRERRQVLRIGNKGEIARAGVFDARHAHDLDLAVAFEAAGQPFGQLTQLHRGMGRSISEVELRRVTHSDAFEERREMLQAQLFSYFVHATVARLAVEKCRFAKLGQRLARLSRPHDAAQSL